MEKGEGLETLLRENERAAQFYCALPEDLQYAVQQHAARIDSLKSLRRCAEDLTRRMF
ncbi:MAG: hypothetical protein ACLSS9_08360 [Acutalibacteraceae bacterium]